MGYDEADPFFDPDDLSHNLFATGYELDQEGLAITVGGLARDEPGDHEGLSLVDQDTLGRAVGLPSPDPDDVAAAAERDVQRARSRLRHAAGGRGLDAGIQGVPGSVRNPERSAGPDEPSGAPDSPRDERGRVAAYLKNPDAKRLHRDDQVKVSVSRRPKRQASFQGAKFAIELGEIKHLPSGQMRITLVVPFEDKAEALKLTDTPGLLLEASVTPVEDV